MRRDYSSPGRTGSTSTTTCTASTRLPAAVALRQPCRAPRVLISRLQRFYINHAARPGASAHHAALHAALRAARRRLLRLAQACRRLLLLRRATGCLGTSCGSSHGSLRRSSSTTPPRTGSSSTTSPPPRVRVPRHVARLVTRLVAPLVVDYSASHWLVIDYFAFAVRPGASACHAARHAVRRVACRRLLRLVQARRRLLRQRRAPGSLGTSRGSSRRSSWTTPPRAGSSSTTLPTPPDRVPGHVARLIAWLVAPLVIDYFAYAARYRLLRLRRASGCLSMSRGPSRISSSTTPCATTSSCGHASSTSATPCVVTTCLAATLALLQVRRAPPRRRLLVTSRRPFFLTSFPN
jgi:hypothetical protein